MNTTHRPLLFMLEALRRLGLFILAVMCVGCVRLDYPEDTTTPEDNLPSAGYCRDTEDWRVKEWKRFRTSHPYHLQTLAISEPRPGDRCRVLVISEPPPGQSIEDVRSASPLLASLRAHRHPVGYDGWVTDYVTALPSLEPSDFRQLIAQLSQSLYGTAYKAYTSPFDVPSSSGTLDVRIGPDELYTWLFGDGASLRSFLGGEATSAEALLRSKTSGVFLSGEPGLVVWSLPRKSDFPDHRVHARVFALESDLVLGAIGDSDMMLLVGRERQASVDVLPPLRFESLALLDAVDKDELAQSFERGILFAGPIHGGRDWAPIYLSPELVDTEFGSLLNLTDQILKSWSNRGLTRYQNFDYPDPDRFPLPQPLPTFIDPTYSTSVIYNWNTKGMIAAVDVDGKTLIWTAGTGVMPMTYLPEGDETPGVGARAQQAAERAWEGFTSAQDPLLARVNQYTTIFNVFRALRAHDALVDDDGQDSPGHELLKHEAKAVLKNLAVATDQELDRAARRPYQELKEKLKVQLSEDEQSAVRESMIREFRDLRVRLRALAGMHIEGVNNEHVLEKLASFLVSPFHERLQMEKMLASEETSVEDASLEALAFILAEDLRKHSDALRYFADADKIRNDYARLSQNRPDRTIRTPSLVVSMITGSLAQGSGGHNVGGQLTYLGKNATGRLTQGPEPPATSLSPADLPMLHLSPGKDASVRNARPTDSPVLALGEKRARESGRGFVPTAQPSATSEASAGLGWASRSGGDGGECGASCITVSREPSGEYHVHSGALDLELTTTSPAAAQEVIATANVLGKSKEVMIRFKGFSPDDMRLFIRSMDKQKNILSKAKLAGNVEPKALLAKVFDLRDASTPHVRVLKNGDETTTVAAEVTFGGQSSQGILIAYDTNESPSHAEARAFGRAVRRDLRSLGKDADATAGDLAEELLSDLDGAGFVHIHDEIEPNGFVDINLDGLPALAKID